ncbi:MAG: sulfurtransferase [Thiomicrorhabdus sp.]|nr:sulfurtransferase [Thiomicrorhabdus sp.]
MKKTTQIALSSLIVSGMFASSLMAAPVPENPKHQTPQGLYVTAKEAAEMMRKDPNVILVDVRTPEEWQFVGHTGIAQIMVPSVKFDYSKLDTKKPRYQPVPNANFISELEERAADLDADEESTYILMCRSGSSRSQPAAKMMDQYGYENVYIMVDGFEGKKTKTGDKKGFRLENGWKNSGEPWTYDITETHVYFEEAE